MQQLPPPGVGVEIGLGGGGDGAGRDGVSSPSNTPRDGGVDVKGICDGVEDVAVVPGVLENETTVGDMVGVMLGDLLES